MSHLDPYEVTKMLKWTKKKYGNMNIIRDRKNYLLVMDVDYSSTGEGKWNATNVPAFYLNICILYKEKI